MPSSLGFFAENATHKFLKINKMAENATAEESGKTFLNVFVARLERVSGIDL